MIVVDNALICYLIIPGELTDEAERVRALDPEWIAPPLWISEFRNVLRTYIMKRVLSIDSAITYVEIAEELMNGRTLPVGSADVLWIAGRSGLSAHDAEYVALAAQHRLTLVTPDGGILKRFPDIACHPAKFGRAT